VGAVATVLERMREVLEKGTFSSARAWSEAAGLTPVHVSKILKRLKTEPEAIELRTVSKLARAAKVSTGWLLGEDVPAVERDDIFPSRAKAAAMAMNFDATYVAIEHVCTAPEYQRASLSHKDLKWWIGEMVDESKRRSDEHHDVKQAVQRKNEKRADEQAKVEDAARIEAQKKNPSTKPPSRRKETA